MRLPVLSSDCSSCSGLCCVLPRFRRVDGFGTSKPAGVPCHHLTAADTCEIHRTLRTDGWPGCTQFECFGAGQHLTQVTYGGSWREQRDLGEMAAVFDVVRALHEMMLHLASARDRAPDPRQDELLAELVLLDRGDPASLARVDVDTVASRVGELLGEASARVRRTRSGPDLERADLAGRDLADRDLRGAALRGALLIRTDLSRSDLTDADVLGADLRDADVRGARLAGTLFLTQPQVNAALGDGATTLPPGLSRPGHWTVEGRAAR